MTISIDPIQSFDEVEADWRALFARVSDAKFFLSPAWMTAWLTGDRSPAKLFCVRAKTGGQLNLIGIVGTANTGAPALGINETRLHGLCDPARDAIYIEYNDFLAEDDLPDVLRADALQAVFESFPQSDQFVFQNITEPMAMAVRASVDKRDFDIRELQVQPTFHCELKTIRDTRADFSASLSKSLRAKINRAKRLYEERGALQFILARGADARKAAFDKLTALHQEGWRRRGAVGAFANPQFVAFHERLMAVAPDETHLIELRAGEQTIAVLYNFVCGDRVSAYQSGFRFEEDNRYVPGYVAHALACQYYLEAGFDVYDFLAGEAEYKRRFGQAGPSLSTLCVERRNVKMRVRALARGIKGAFSRD